MWDTKLTWPISGCGRAIHYTKQQPKYTWLINAEGGLELHVMAESYVWTICFLHLLIRPAGFGLKPWSAVSSILVHIPTHTYTHNKYTEIAMWGFTNKKTTLNRIRFVKIVIYTIYSSGESSHATNSKSLQTHSSAIRDLGCTWI